MSREIDYGNLMHAAMRGLIKTVLKDVAANGLPGAHHFSSPLTPRTRTQSWPIGCQIAFRTK